MPPAVTETEKARAISRYVRVAPNKVRQVVAHIRGLEVAEARRVLRLSPKGVAEQVLKTLNSAVANAEHNANPPYDADELVVTSVVVDEGPMLKRFQPRAMGRAYRIRKRTSHITVAVGTPVERTPRAPQRAHAGGAATPATPAAPEPVADPDTDTDTDSDTAPQAAPAESQE